MAREKKVTWDDVYRDYKKHFPKSSKEAFGFEPYDFATILIFFPQGVRGTYNYDTKKFERLKKKQTSRWLVANS